MHVLLRSTNSRPKAPHRAYATVFDSVVDISRLATLLDLIKVRIILGTLYDMLGCYGCTVIPCAHHAYPYQFCNGTKAWLEVIV